MSNHLDASQMFRVDALVALVTGGGSGLGRIMAHALAQNGAKAVYILGRRGEALEETAKQAGAHSSTIIPIVGDVTSKESLAAAAARIRSEQGFLNVLVANSGIGGPRVAAHLPAGRAPTLAEFQKAMFDIPMADFTQTLHVNCTCTFYTVLAFLDLLDAGNAQRNVAPQSQVVIVTSIAGLSRMLASGFAYSNSKAAAHHLSKMLSTYLLPYRIRVNSIAPGFYLSEMTAARFEGKDVKPWEEGALDESMVPMRRAGSEANMAGAALYLISDAGSYVNGEFLVTDGGRLAMGLQ